MRTRGGPTLSFLIQGAGFLIEGTRPGRRWLRRGPAGRLWTAAVALLPLPLLLHRPLLTDFAADYFTLLGVPGLLS